MVVVAIIGILASVAVPQYSKFQAKARAVEAKSSLGAVYTIEASFYSDASYYTGCLANIGYAVTSGTKSYYTVGFSSIGTGAANFVPSDTSQACTAGAGTSYFTAGIADGGGTATSSVSSSAVANTGNFTAEAAGNISKGATTRVGESILCSRK